MKKILLVEDDQFLVDIYTTKLKETGFLVRVAPDGEDCLKKLKEDLPDLLLLDIVLPHMDGWEIIRAIRQDEKFKNLKIVILSNLGQKDEVEKGFELGVLRYFIKAHYTPSEVVAEVKQILQ